MPRVQADAYTQAIDRAREGGGRGHMLKTLGDLRSVSLHPGLSRDDSDAVRAGVVRPTASVACRRCGER